jgi:hypothetical protein
VVTPRALCHFPYSSPEPWSWIPGTWIQPGVVFVAGEGRFYRFVERTDDGWNAEEVKPSAVGEQPRLTEIAELRTGYERALAAHDGLDRRMRNGEDTPENRSLLHEQDEELHRLRDRLILLCNARMPEVRARTKDPGRRNLLLVAALAVVFVLSLVYCIRTVLAVVPEQAGTILVGTIFAVTGTALFIIVVRELAKRKNRLVTGNLVGCYTLLALAVIVAAFGIMLVSVMLHYMGAYGE